MKKVILILVIALSLIGSTASADTVISTNVNAETTIVAQTVNSSQVKVFIQTNDPDYRFLIVNDGIVAVDDLIANKNSEIEISPIY